ncbi:DUF4231 domain-containing protein [Azospirillum rugosum]|uniref:DUF4231 domain-containing protein n=1 Tax=Azospirillum rugosum TaxID=416170 RepID=A0ABS4SGT3_9PROT|nr:DUF4231 domain-containing protein [Azospirillum rugosum]MBP2291781.1 hypothetical protein [Azospirillum rugosum]MDQ0524407.1 hypothetical protein [Azospirillum rugosum]
MKSDTPFDYPAIYIAASKLSDSSQKTYLLLLRMEYGLLILASILSLDLDNSRLYYAHSAFIFIISLAVLLYRSKTKPEQFWYKGRALAESIKTSTWRYCMRAAPFEGAADHRLAKAEFRNLLKSVLEANRHIGERIPPDSAANDQITTSMDTVRGLDLEERKNLYEVNRIREQRLWYQTKAAYNKKRESQWVALCVFIYFMAILFTLMRITYPEWKLWPNDTLIVIASSIVGWVQIKKFNELSSAYTLTAHEIGILQGKISEVDSESSFSEFVNEAELAFSREHTQWVARQNL